MSTDGAPRSGRLIILTGLPASGKTTLSIEIAARSQAIRMCPDEWMIASGIDLWDAACRDEIERAQAALSVDLLRRGETVIIEWGTWGRGERDELRDAARSIGAAVELRFLDCELDELWRRIDARNLERRHGSRAVERRDLEEWTASFERPTAEEFSTYDDPLGA